MSEQSLQDALNHTENPVEMFRAIGGHVEFPYVATEYTNWIDEQRAWRETCCLADLTHHQMDQIIKGPDAIDLFSKLCVNSFAGFEVGKAKQAVMCNPDGKMIGDGILQYIGEDEFVLSGSPSPANWLEFHIEQSDLDVTSTMYPMSIVSDRDPHLYTYQVQGPNALDVMEEAIDGQMPEIPFFEFDTVSINGHDVRALRHGMAGEVGFELQGPYEDSEEILGTLLHVGESYGLRRLGTRSYKSTPVIVGWVDVFVKAVYEHVELEEYREWLSANSFEGSLSISGSFETNEISDYYLSPVDVGYEHIISFDHEFIGKEALQEEVNNPERTLVTLVWDPDDTSEIFASRFRGETPYKFMDLPRAPMRGHYDEVLVNQNRVGLSRHPAYTHNERAMLSLCVIDREFSEPGTEVKLVWGEPEGKSPNPTIEPHAQTEIRATVAPVPFVEDKRKENWTG